MTENQRQLEPREKSEDGKEKAAFEKYLHKPYFGSSHSWAQEKLTIFNSESRVLDVGSGQGAMGSALKNLGVQQVVAVEIDPTTREHTQHLYSKIVANLEELKGEHFDGILLLDIIEHLPNPSEFLHELTAFCSPGTDILISVPNIAHWIIRAMLLCGYFEYMERGPLDKTHLHFFTKRHLRAMIQSTPGLRIDSWDSSIVPLELMLPKWLHENQLFEFSSRCRKFFAKALPELGAYQLLVHVKFAPGKS
jgi:2-polyprenyl-3-methyl-5-hydroxy-6-metoxy-1,4-benzoquinol methylase